MSTVQARVFAGDPAQQQAQQSPVYTAQISMPEGLGNTEGIQWGTAAVSFVAGMAVGSGVTYFVMKP